MVIAGMPMIAGVTQGITAIHPVSPMSKSWFEPNTFHITELSVAIAYTDGAQRE